jgi:hypothetical protein
VFIAFPSTNANSVAASMMYSKPGALINEPLDKNEIDKFLSCNAGTSKWEYVDGMKIALAEKGLKQREIITEAAKSDCWFTSDLRLYAIYDKFEHRLRILTAEFSKFLEDSKAKSLSGF